MTIEAFCWLCFALCFVMTAFFIGYACGCGATVKAENKSAAAQQPSRGDGPARARGGT